MSLLGEAQEQKRKIIDLEHLLFGRRVGCEALSSQSDVILSKICSPSSHRSPTTDLRLCMGWEGWELTVVTLVRNAGLRIISCAAFRDIDPYTYPIYIYMDYGIR